MRRKPVAQVRVLKARERTVVSGRADPGPRQRDKVVLLSCGPFLPRQGGPARPNLLIFQKLVTFCQLI